MILLSKITDASKVTFDCAKATIERNGRIEIDDIHWKSPEVQGALKLGLIELEGQPPIMPEEPLGLAPEHLIRFRNNFGTKLCFECVKDYADPGMIIRIPVSLVDNPEVRNAIMAGMLINEDNPEENPQIYQGPPMHLEELRSSDIISGVDSDLAADLAQVLNRPASRNQELPEGVPATRPVKKPAPTNQIKAKKIYSTGESEGDDDGAGELYRPSEVRMPKAPALKRPVSQLPRIEPMNVEDGPQDDFDFTDIFSSKKK